MEKEKSKGNMILYFFKMLGIFIVIDLAISMLPGLITDNVLNFKYGTDLLMELFYGLFALIVMLLFHNSYVFNKRHTKFKDSIKLALPMVVFSLIHLLFNAITLDGVIWGNLINVIILCVFIGFAEEFLCRGWLQNEFLERFGEDRKGVLKSILCASIVFGSMHLINVFTTSQGLVMTIFQIINAMALGFYLGVIYYRTKNIWSVIFLHAFYDFALFLGEVNLVKDCTTGVLSGDVILANIITISLLSLFWVLSSVYIIKKTNFPDVKAEKKKVSNALLITGIVVVGIMSIVPFEALAEGYEESYVCYDYQVTSFGNNYTIHFPNYDEYFMKHERESKTYIMSDENPNDVTEVVVMNKYNISVKLKNGRVYVTNNNTGYENSFGNGISNFEVIENIDSFIILASKDALESTVYYSDYTIKNNMVNDDEFIDEIVNSFISYELPVISEIGYITYDNAEYKYPIFYSENNDYFIVKNGELFLMQ